MPARSTRMSSKSDGNIRPGRRPRQVLCTEGVDFGAAEPLASLAVAASAREPLRHRKIGSYRVQGQLARGGMAQVYRGVHETLQREVAIKELLPEWLKDEESLSRFRREALALAAFRHQNIVTLYDLVEKNDSLF